MTMKNIPTLLALFAITNASMAYAASDANTIGSYALHAPLSISADVSLHRLDLPVDALVRIQTSGYSDVRVFDAKGQSVPLALALVEKQIQTQNQQVTLPAYPILGTAGTLSNEGVSLRIEEQQGKRVVQIDTGSTKTAANGKNLIGVLLDARAITDPVVAMALDVDLPIAQPISFDVQASKDLRSWRSVADTVLYRPAEGIAASSSNDFGKQRMQLTVNDVKDHYLRITWQGSAGQIASVNVRSAVLTTTQSSITPRISAVIATPAQTNPHELSFSLPFATPLAALKIKPQGVNVLVPVRVWGRNNRSQAWTPLASAVLYNLVSNGKEQSNSAVEFLGERQYAAYREIKIEADKKTAGFATAPEVSALFEPVQIVFLASGVAPFTLTVGLSEAASAFLPLASLIPGYKNGQENTLSQARVVMNASASANTPVIAAQSPSSTPPARSLLLWGILFAGVAALGLMAYVLIKQTKKAPIEST
jgi:Protein of unknown function (DUF3999)